MLGRAFKQLVLKTFYPFNIYFISECYIVLYTENKNSTEMCSPVLRKPWSKNLWLYFVSENLSRYKLLWFYAVLGIRRKVGVPGWLSQLSIGLLISAQVMISQFMSQSPTSSSVLMMQNLFGILYPSFYPSLAHVCAHSLSLSLSLRINKPKFI